MRYLIAMFFALTCALPGVAQDMMSAKDFDNYTKGKTFYYGSLGEPYGAE